MKNFEKNAVNVNVTVNENGQKFNRKAYLSEISKPKTNKVVKFERQNLRVMYSENLHNSPQDLFKDCKNIFNSYLTAKINAFDSLQLGSTIRTKATKIFSVENLENATPNFRNDFYSNVTDYFNGLQLNAIKDFSETLETVKTNSNTITENFRLNGFVIGVVHILENVAYFEITENGLFYDSMQNGLLDCNAKDIEIYGNTTTEINNLLKLCYCYETALPFITIGKIVENYILTGFASCVLNHKTQLISSGKVSENVEIKTGLFFQYTAKQVKDYLTSFVNDTKEQTDKTSKQVTNNLEQSNKLALLD